MENNTNNNEERNDSTEEIDEDEAFLSDFEKKVRAQEKEVKEGKPKKSITKLTDSHQHRGDNKTSPEEMMPVNKNSPLAISAVLVLLFGMFGLLAIVAGEQSALLSGGIMGAAVAAPLFIILMAKFLAKLMEDSSENVDKI